MYSKVTHKVSCRAGNGAQVGLPVGGLVGLFDGIGCDGDALGRGVSVGSNDGGIEFVGWFAKTTVMVRTMNGKAKDVIQIYSYLDDLSAV